MLYAPGDFRIRLSLSEGNESFLGRRFTFLMLCWHSTLLMQLKVVPSKGRNTIQVGYTSIISFVNFLALEVLAMMTELQLKRYYTVLTLDRVTTIYASLFAQYKLLQTQSVLPKPLFKPSIPLLHHQS
jgi:hypothetical protein